MTNNEQLKATVQQSVKPDLAYLLKATKQWADMDVDQFIIPMTPEDMVYLSTFVPGGILSYPADSTPEDKQQATDRFKDRIKEASTLSRVDVRYHHRGRMIKEMTTINTITDPDIERMEIIVTLRDGVMKLNTDALKRAILELKVSWNLVRWSGSWSSNDYKDASTLRRDVTWVTPKPSWYARLWTWIKR